MVERAVATEIGDAEDTRDMTDSHDSETVSRPDSQAGGSDLVVVLGVGPADEGRIGALTDAVTDLAGGGDVTVHVVHVLSADELDEPPEHLSHDVAASPDPDGQATLREPVGEVVDRLRRAERDGLTVEVVGEVADDPGPVLLGVAERVGADRVVVGGRKRTPAGKAIFGSTSQYVLLNAPCPVTYVREG